eukprot:NODE_1150_length_1078_cov_224.990282_g878_i0.p1 GENE.NODE_1150_length_1078_cov_224.990282_g878_i0~~NODE_1150_length_1078_cov_224.990282_g878_i0.p1  ORF type:complete len:287 (-),score=70.22 NODE_1150_length_1078_cov_224.990282_g878_i0:143-1003(-)
MARVSRVLLKQPRVQPTPFAKYGNVTTQKKLQHLVDAVAGPPPNWKAKPKKWVWAPKKWGRNGLGLYLCTLTPEQLEEWALKQLRPHIDRITEEDDGYLVEDLKNFMFRKATLQEKIVKAAQVAFSVEIPPSHQTQMSQVTHLTDWLAQRVELARPVPTYDIPAEANQYLNAYNHEFWFKITAAYRYKKEHRRITYNPWAANYEYGPTNFPGFGPYAQLVARRKYLLTQERDKVDNAAKLREEKKKKSLDNLAERARKKEEKKNKKQEKEAATAAAAISKGAAAEN